MLFKLGENKVDIDVKATEKLYMELMEADKQCFCVSCRNYNARLRRISNTAADFFSSMGVNPAKASRVWAYLPGDLPHTQRYWCVLPLVYGTFDVSVEDSYETIEDGLMACFAMVEGEVALVLDWRLRWVSP